MKSVNCESRRLRVNHWRSPLGSRQRPTTNNQQLPTGNRRRPAARRGVLILVVLSLLVIFAMIAISFVLIAGQQERAAKAAAKMEQTGKDPQELLDGAMYQLLRDTHNDQSVVRGHSLLRDMYGSDGFGGVVSDLSNPNNLPDVTPNTGGQFVDVEVTASSVPLSQISNYYAGQTLTFVDGPLSGSTTRIVRYSYDPIGVGQFTVMRPKADVSVADALFTIRTGISAIPAEVYRVWINGRPFNGTGAGYDTTADVDKPKLTVPGYHPGIDGAWGVFDVDDDGINGRDDIGEAGWTGSDDVLIPTVALQPNRVFPPSENLLPQNYLTGGLDESYDAVDYQNMALAYLPVGAGETDSTTDNSPTDRDAAPQLIPSFHRPALVNYWYHWMANDPDGYIMWPAGWSSDPDLIWGAILDPVNNAPDDATAERIITIKRKVNLRPLREDHPQFTGSNLSAGEPRPDFTDGTDPYSYREMVGPWDIDNDGDGVRDSVWVDLGFPVMRTRNGRLYKPLFAFLCVDLDGRLNVNAHGTVSDVNVTQGLPITQVVPRTLAGGASSETTLPRGQGYGPPEISLRYVIDIVPEYRNVVATRTAEDLQPGGLSLVTDPHALIQFFDVPDGSDGLDSVTMERMAYGSVPNLHGAYGIGLDARGNPVVEAFATDDTLRQDTPYEMDLSRSGARGRMTKDWGIDGSWGTADDAGPADKPFSVYELERVLRPFDVDAGLLEARLRDQIDVSLTATLSEPERPKLGRLLTTDSWSLPVPNVATTRELREDATNPLKTARNVVDLLRARIEIADSTFTNDQINAIIFGSPAAIGSLPAQPGILSADLAMGLRMDVNRPFGNGRDDGTNDVVDEPGENTLADPDQLWLDVPQVAGAPFRPYDADGDGTIDDTDYLLQRQLYARHLYVLMMALTDAGYTPPDDGSGISASDREKLHARRIAQWAINAVDFRDADAIMTPFEYDAEPFDGWDVDGNLTSTNDWDNNTAGDGTDDTGGVVWGCERPELLITETLAWHDRRTEDLKTDASGEHTASHPSDAGTDGDFDQRMRPRGAFFVELYNPSSLGEVYPQEFYGTFPGFGSAIALDRISGQDAAGNESPVWRLVVVHDASHDPDNDPSTDDALDPDDANPIVGSDFNRSHIERTVYHTNLDNIANLAIPADGQQYYTSIDPDPVRPGHYAVVGSSSRTGGEFGRSLAGRRTDTVIGGSLYTANTRQVALNPASGATANQVEVLNNDINTPPDNEIKRAVAVAVNKAGNNIVRSLSISEPTGLVGDLYYDANDDAAVPVAFDPSALGGEGAYPTPHDSPLDENRADGTILTKDGKYANFRTVHLQRLANPLIPWDAQENPYRTVDTMSVDLTVFNGVEGHDDPTVTTNGTNGPDHFQSLQRGDTNPAFPLPGSRKLWPHEPPTTGAIDTPGTTVPHVFSHRLIHTLGYLNDNDGVKFDDVSSPNIDADGDGRRDFIGDPATAATEHTFPWLTWNNRPFVSQYELMLVPASSSSRLFYEFSLADTGATVNPYQSKAIPANPTEDLQNFRAPFAHLLNFFQTAKTLSDNPIDKTKGDLAAHFYRLFDYTHVPSRFVGTETVLNPATFGQLVSETENFRPPFNKVSTYREPGRVNLNTITDERVWGGIINGHDGPLFDSNVTLGLVDSRRGYDTNSTGDTIIGKVLELNNNSPTFFANPFRGSGAGELVPLEGLMRPDVETTLLRSDNVGDPSDVAKNNPTSPPDSPLFDRPSGLAYDDPARNPYFRYQSINRLGNLVTTRSNVYAVWVTVGYFEVQPAPAPLNAGGTVPHIPNQAMRDLVYPDGYQLDQELGSDTGEITRHRGFYIIDRSVPVAFEPGENHDVDRAVLLRRFIE